MNFKMKKVIRFASLLFVAGALALTSCTKEEISLQEDTDLLIQAENDAVSEVILEAIDAIIDREIDLLERYNYDVTKLKSAEADACDPVISVETPTDAKFPKRVTLDWGSGCTDSNDNFRAGMVVVEITGPVWAKKSVRTAVLKDYIFNDLKIEGKRVMENKGRNEDGFFLFRIENSMKVSMAESGEIVSESEWKRERVQNRGEDLKSIEDDEIWITGSSKIERNEKKIVKEITVPLYRMLTCKHFQSGEVITFINDEKVSGLNYGEGACDDEATVTNFKTEKTKTITLKSQLSHYAVRK